MVGSSIKQPIRFITMFLVISFIILICDQGIGRILKYYYFSQKSGELYRTTYAIDSTMSDIVILGSSRAKCGYVPGIFEDSLNLSCYNTGRDGNFILFNYEIFKEITKRYNPRLIIFDIAPEELEFRSWEYDRLSILLPYYQTHSEIRSSFCLRDPYIRIKCLSEIYPFNSLLFKIVLGNLELNKKRSKDHNGFAPYFKTLQSKQIDTIKIGACILDKNKIQNLKNIVSTCKQRNIGLVFVHSPVWSIIQDNFCDSIISGLCRESGISYINISNHPTFINNPAYFADIHHLNIEGAQIFSNMLINRIRFDKSLRIND
jgi:hypothetical protein